MNICTASRTRRTETPGWTSIGVAVFAIALVRSLSAGFGMADEGWFLQVIQRVRSGDVLYRDVFFGVTPLSLYLTTALTHIIGIEVVAVKIVTNACFAVTTVLTGRIALRAGLSGGTSLAIMSVLVAGVRPDISPPYTPLAIMLFIAVLGAVIARLGEHDQEIRYRDALVVGGLAGLSFAAKQNVGLLALAASLGAMLWTNPTRASRRRVLGCCLLCVAACGLTALILVSPIIIAGGLPGLWEYGFAAKGAYIQAGMHYPSLRNWIDTVRTLPSAAAVVELMQGGLFLVLPVAVIVIVFNGRAFDRRSRILVVFAAAAAAAAFPRWDRLHLSYGVPALLLLLAYQFRRSSRPETGRRLPYLQRAWLFAAGCALLVGAETAMSVARSGLRASAIPHVRGVLLASDDERHLRDAAARLAAAADGRPMFILSLRAGFWYLASGVKNPTPFDIPAATSVGRTGARALLDQISNGTLLQVCVDNDLLEPLDLTAVAALIKVRFVKGPDVGPCTVYRAPAAVNLRREQR